jgi:hypothetical protein
VFNEHHEFIEYTPTSSSLSLFDSSSPRLSNQPNQPELKNSNQPIRPNLSKQESDFERGLSALTKLYSEDAKYSDENDSFSFKSIIFHDICRRADVLHETKLIVFLSMLKRLALDYFYSNMSISTMISATFDEICFQMKAYFENAKYKKSILFK